MQKDILHHLSPKLSVSSASQRQTRAVAIAYIVLGVTGKVSHFWYWVLVCLVCYGFLWKVCLAHVTKYIHPHTRLCVHCINNIKTFICAVYTIFWIYNYFVYIACKICQTVENSLFDNSLLIMSLQPFWCNANILLLSVQRNEASFLCE